MDRELEPTHEVDSAALRWPAPARWRLDQWIARTGFNADSTRPRIARWPQKARVADSLQASAADLIGIDDARPVEPVSDVSPKAR